MDPHLLQCLLSTLLGSLKQKVLYCYLYCNSKYYHGSSETCLEPYKFRIFFTYCKQLHEDTGVYKNKFFKIPAWQDLRPATYNFVKKRLQHKCFTVKLLRALCSTEQFRWLLFKISNSNDLFKDVSVVSLTQNQSLITCNSHSDKII